MKSFLLLLPALFTLAQCTRQPECANPLSVAGTPVSLCPPVDFDLKTDLGGFRHKSLPASIMVMEVAQAFEKAVPELTVDKLSAQGITLLSKTNVTTSGRQGVLCNVDKNSGGTPVSQWILLLPNGTSSVTVNGTFLKKDEEKFSKAVKQALMTTQIDEKSMKDESVLSFKVDVSATPLKLAKILQGPSAAYNLQGAWPATDTDDFSFFVGPSTSNPMMVPDEQTAMEQLKQLCENCQYNPDSVAAVTIDSLKGFEIVAFAPADSVKTKTLKYQVVLFDGSRYFLMVGSASKDHKQNVEVFRGVSQTFRKR
jgi:hypothetical protein